MVRTGLLALTVAVSAGFMLSDDTEGQRVGNLVVVDGEKTEIEAEVGDVLQINYSYAVRPPMPKNLKVEATGGLKKMAILKVRKTVDGKPSFGSMALAAMIKVEKAGDATVTITPVGNEKEPVKYTVKVSEPKEDKE